MQNFRDLRVWERAQCLATRVHGATKSLSGTDAAGLRSQLRRSSTSIGANIAEGATSGGGRQFARYLQMAIASAAETESHLDFAERVGFLPPAAVIELIAETVQLRRQIVALRKRVVAASDTHNP
jgi:four helix bundle protein